MLLTVPVPLLRERAISSYSAFGNEKEKSDPFNCEHACLEALLTFFLVKLNGRLLRWLVMAAHEIALCISLAEPLCSFSFT